MKKSNTIYYQKPQSICQDKNIWNYHPDTATFISRYKKNIDDYFKKNGFHSRPGTIKDTGKLNNFIRKSYEVFGEAVVNDVSPYDIYRFAKFGNATILEDNQNLLVGCIFEIGYDTPDRTSYTIRLAIDQDIKGKNMGLLLLEYSCLLAMERGSMVKRGLMETYNLASCNILVNKIGWICDGFEKDLDCGIDNGFTVSLPLTPEGFTSNRIDNDKLLHFIKHHKAEKDFMLINTDDIDKINDIYEKNTFWVVAVIRKAQISEQDRFFALPVEVLQIH